MSYYEFKELTEEYQKLILDFDHIDWRTLRNKDYWESDKIGEALEKLRYKMVRIRYYYKYGVPLKID